MGIIKFQMEQKGNKFKNVKSYKKVHEKHVKAQEPYVIFHIGQKDVRNKVKDMLAYEGIGELNIPGSFLGVIPEITHLPVVHIIDLLDISKSTYYRAKEDEVLDMETVDKLASILKLYQRGVEAFGDSEAFKDWLYTQVTSLGGQKPIDLLKTENGRLAILDAIDRVEYGVYG